MSAYCPVCKTSFLDVEKREKVGKITGVLVAGMGVAVWLESFLLFFLFALVLCVYKSGFRLAKMDVSFPLDKKRPSQSLAFNPHWRPSFRSPRRSTPRSHRPNLERDFPPMQNPAISLLL